jgi:hypothetical protein
MKINLISGVLLVFICFTSAVSFSQQQSFEFEKIGIADFSDIKTKDSSAVAEVVADVGRTRFEYGPEGFYLIFKRQTRIHILKPEGTSHATIEIPLYKNKNDKEQVASFKGATYNLEKGEVVKTKVKNEDMFLENESEHWDNKKIAMPAVKANSIIEFEYEVHSNFTFNLQPWAFQSDIPVYWSEYNVKFPEYFIYKTFAQGYIPFVINTKTSSQQQFTVHYEAESGLGNGFNQGERVPAHTETYKMQVDECRWVATEVPAMKPEPFITTVSDYISKIEFELSVVKMPGTLDRNVMDTWETLTTKLLEDEDFGATIRKGGFISDQLPAITGQANSKVEKLNAIYDHVKYRMKWNGDNGIYSNNTPKKIYEERTGSVSDINLMLVAILKEAGYNAEPVILSTRSHGRLQDIYPILSKFNYVVAKVTVDTAIYMLDATSKYLPFNTLPERCLNGNGRVISKTNSKWIQLLNNEVKSDFTQVDMTLSEDGSLKGRCVVTSAGLDGNDRRNTYMNKNEKEFIEDFNAEHTTWSVTEFHMQNLDTLDKPFTETYDLEIPEEAQVAGDHLYLNVMAGFGKKTNPFKLEKRAYPVDFSCPIKENYQVKITIPQGWVVEQLPKMASISLPDKGGSFKFVLAETNGVIQVISTLKINKNMFLPTEYDQLKEFFRLIVAKQAEQIVLKKA